jgi:Amt family ammonium transporter
VRGRSDQVRRRVGAFTFTVSFVILYLFKISFGIRTEPEVEEAGLDVSEHGMWGYPEFYIPVPGGYGTDSPTHLIGASAHRASTPPAASAPPPAAVEGV